MKLRAYAQLVRLPNLFTALSDALLGTLAAGNWQDRPAQSAALVAASASLYSAGMVWNDYFDLEIDRRERPFRPLPSGRIPIRHAAMLGVILLAVGLGLATLAGWGSQQFRLQPAVLAGTLILAILLYDGWFKNLPVGPLSMGACRFLNILLATSLAADSLSIYERFHLAGIIGLYIIGVTWFARRETVQSSSTQLRVAAATITTSIFASIAIPLHRPPDSTPTIFPYFVALFLVGIMMPILRAIQRPDPKHVQSAVKWSILGLILLDSILLVAYVGPIGLLLALLLLPALLLARLFYST